MQADEDIISAVLNVTIDLDKFAKEEALVRLAMHNQRMTRVGSNDTHAFLIRPSGGVFRKFACPLKKFQLAEVEVMSLCHQFRTTNYMHEVVFGV